MDNKRKIIIAVALIALVVALVIFVYWVIEPSARSLKPGQQKYFCKNGQCVLDENGVYATKEDCEKTHK